VDEAYKTVVPEHVLHQIPVPAKAYVPDVQVPMSVLAEPARVNAPVLASPSSTTQTDAEAVV